MNVAFWYHYYYYYYFFVKEMKKKFFLTEWFYFSENTTLFVRNVESKNLTAVSKVDKMASIYKIIFPNQGTMDGKCRWKLQKLYQKL